MSAVHTIAEFIQESKVFYLATNGEKGPDVRPMGLAIPFKDRLYFVAAKPMNIHQQLQKDGKVAISAYDGKKILRLSATAVLDESAETAEAFIGLDQRIAEMFPESIIAPYYLKDAKASIGVMGGPAETCEF